LSTNPARIILKDKRDAPFRRGHPWVFSGAIEKTEGEITPGTEAAVVDRRGDFIAWGLCNPNSQITVRLYSWNSKEKIDERFLRERLSNAVALRKSLPAVFTGRESEAARLVFSESDGISGLIVDYYAGYLALQLTSLALSFKLDLITKLLQELLKPKGIYLRTEKGIRELEGLEISDKLLSGGRPEGPIVIRENEIAFEMNLTEGHKTGFYLDQRDNRKRAAEFARGRRALDVCCYTGGFTLNLAKGGAESVTGIDSSAVAVEAAVRNAQRNKITNVEFVKGDAFASMEKLLEEKNQYGLIVLDPPRFAQKSKGLSQALKGYAGLNGLAARLLTPGGILVTCSCSGRVTREEFRGMLSEVSQSAGRRIEILEERGAAPDHPVSAACPESDYLKCFICYVE